MPGLRATAYATDNRGLLVLLCTDDYFSKVLDPHHHRPYLLGSAPATVPGYKTAYEPTRLPGSGSQHKIQNHA